MSEDMAARRLKLLGGNTPAAQSQALADHMALLALVTDSQGQTTEAHQALRALQKDYLSALKTDESRDDAREAAYRAEIAALNAQLVESEAARGRAEGECAGLRAALAAEAQRAITIQMPPEVESAPVGYTMRVIRDGANQIRDVKLIPEENG